jgi:hypothetical protein
MVRHINPAAIWTVVMNVKKLLAGGVIVLLLISLALVWNQGGESKKPEKPPLWGLVDPPLSENLTWIADGNVELANATISNAPGFYGELESQLLGLGYTMFMGNWSSTKCQWSVWNSVSHNRTYYIAYSGNRFLGIRGSYVDVMDALGKEWLCQDPSEARPIAAPSPETMAKAISLQLGDIFMTHNITIGRANWSGPMPDWYLGEFSFRADVGKGVDVLVLVYTTRDQAEYAVYQLAEKAHGLRILKSYGGQYYSLIVTKGDPKDVDKAVRIIQSSVNTQPASENSTKP